MYHRWRLIVLSALGFLVLSAYCSAQERAASGHQGIHEGNRLLKEGKWPEAQQAFEQVVADEPGSVEGHHQLAVTLALTKEWDRSREEFERSLQAETGVLRPFIQFNLGALSYHVAMARKDESQLGEAPIYLARAAMDVPAMGLASDMMRFTRHVGRGSTLLLVDVTGLPPDTAMFAQTAGSGETAVYEFGNESVPPLYCYGSPTCQALLASTMNDRSQYLTTLSNAIQFAGDEPPSRCNTILKWTIFLAKAETAQDPAQFEGAIADLNQAIALGLPFPRPYTYLGMIYGHQQRYREAQALAMKALALDAEYQRAQDLLTILDQRSPDR